MPPWTSSSRGLFEHRGRRYGGLLPAAIARAVVPAMFLPTAGVWRARSRISRGLLSASSVYLRYLSSATVPMLGGALVAVNTQNTYFEREVNNSAGMARSVECNVTAFNDAHWRCLEARQVNLDLVCDLIGRGDRDCRCRCRCGGWRRECRGT